VIQQSLKKISSARDQTNISQIAGLELDSSIDIQAALILPEDFGLLKLLQVPSQNDDLANIKT
jgi:uncharacterized protein (UPF0254 family)